ncbi:MAG TPA: SPOR domain-containing protein [Fluviicola sp.]|nr:SPOR domain-containing protein [Fluviicola sp.]
MNNYLLQLLKEVKTLIIPNLGAFTITDETSGEIMFMPYLKYDDGTLANHIAEKENIDVLDAKSLIAKFVRDVTTELDKGETYDMYQFGVFSKVDGEISFKSWEGKATSQSEVKPKTEPVIQPVENVEKPAEQKKSEEKPAEASISEPKSTDKESIVEKPAEEKKEIPEKPAEAIAAKEPEKITEKPKTKAVEAKKETKSIPKEKIKKEKTEKTTGKNRSVLSYLIWGFLILLLGSGVYVFLNYDSLKKDFPILADLAGEKDNVAIGSEDVKTLDDQETISNEAIEEEQIPQDDTEVVEQETTKEPVKKEVVKEVKQKSVSQPKPEKQTENISQKPMDTSKSYHIIAGSFGSESNANRLAQKLITDGFAEASVSFVNGMHRVSIKGFSSMQEANSELSTIRSKVSNAWIMKM